MINLYTTVTNRIKEVTQKVYFNSIPPKAPTTGNQVTFPYVVYRIPTSTEWELKEDFILEVDIWDNNQNVIRLEQLTQRVDDKLNKWNHVDDNYFIRVSRINRLMLDDLESKIYRRQLRYLVKVYLSGNLTFEGGN